MNNGDRRAPVSLSRNEPVAKPVIDLVLTLRFGEKSVQNGFSAFFRTKSVIFAAVYENSVFDVRKNRFAVRILNNDVDGHIVFFGEEEISRIVSGNAHNRARSVGV